MGYARTALLLAGLTGLFLAAGWLIGGQTGMAIALVIALGMNAFAYWNSDRVVLSMYGAREVDAAGAPRLHGLVRQLADNAGLPPPRIYIIDNPQPNAFATGRDPEHAAVAATSGLLQLLSEEEVAGVMAHELAHVKHRDTLIMTVTATLAGAIGMLANFGLFFGASSDNRNNPLGPLGAILVAILAPLAAMVVQMAISRAREYEADAEGARICGRPLWLAAALGKLQKGVAQVNNQEAEANPATAHLFIVNPLHAHGLDGLFTTHPSTENRIARLRQLALEMGQTGPWG